MTDRPADLDIATVAAERLARWGKHPVLRELQPNKAPKAVSADAYRTRIAGLAEWLRAHGVGERTAVALFLENSIDHLAMLFALFELKAVPVIAKLEYRSIELDEIFANSDPAAVVTEQAHLPVLAPYLRGRHVISREQDGFRVQQRGETRHIDVPDGTASINYTYRGHGYPLGAVVPHAQYLHGARVVQDGLYGYPGESMLFSIPVSHIFTLVGCVILPLLYGLTSVIARTIHPRAIFDYFDTYEIEHVTAIPEIYRLLHRSRPEGRRFPSLCTFVSGGSFLEREEHARIGEAFGVDFCHGYGLTEFTPVSGNLRGRVRPGTVGPVSADVGCRIEGSSHPNEGPGEILLRIPTMATSYYRRPAESREARPDGWFRTGDIGTFEDGHLVFLHEKKRTCKVSGIMVDLEEVKRALLKHPEVAEAEVEFQDGAVRAGVGVSRAENFEEKQKELRTFLQPRIAAYKVPRRFYRL
jgi:long-chain acyl-CoA synthetase